MFLSSISSSPASSSSDFPTDTSEGPSSTSTLPPNLPIGPIRIIVETGPSRLARKHHISPQIVYDECKFQKVGEAESLRSLHSRIERVQEHLESLGLFSRLNTFVSAGNGEVNGKGEIGVDVTFRGDAAAENYAAGCEVNLRGEPSGKIEAKVPGLFGGYPTDLDLK